jgi:hypothetical protein
MMLSSYKLVQLGMLTSAFAPLWGAGIDSPLTASQIDVPVGQIPTLASKTSSFDGVHSATTHRVTDENRGCQSGHAISVISL